MAYKLYNLKYVSLDGDAVYPSRYGIKFDIEVKKDDYVTYNGLLLLVTDIKGLLIEAIEMKSVIHVGRD